MGMVGVNPIPQRPTPGLKLSSTPPSPPLDADEHDLDRTSPDRAAALTDILLLRVLIRVVGDDDVCLLEESRVVAADLAPPLEAEGGGRCAGRSCAAIILSNRCSAT